MPLVNLSHRLRQGVDHQCGPAAAETLHRELMHPVGLFRWAPKPNDDAVPG